MMLLMYKMFHIINLLNVSTKFEKNNKAKRSYTIKAVSNIGDGQTA